MAVNEYDDPRNNPNIPTFRSTTIGQMPSTGTIYSDLHDPALGPVGGGGGNPFSWLWHQLRKPFTNDAPRPVTSPTQPSTPNAKPTTTQTLVNSIPDILAALAALKAMQAGGGANGANPAGDALTGLVPQLSTQLNALLQNDVQRRQMSDPLYQAVLNGAMGGLPVWMRGGVGGGAGGGAGAGLGVPQTGGAPRTPGSGVPVTPGNDLFRDQGGDPEGYAFPNLMPRV